ncbi:MAG TPA: hypothetical protein PLI09_23965 [Candidatus Hydrogenedentes bacterium]|nr:hypothetical protein [Candidatus Hydrogenedentota bacterium]
MFTLYAVCAVAGGIILTIQFILALIGLDHHGMADGSEHFDMHDGAHATEHHGGDTHDSSWFFKLVSFRSMVASITFFGLGGGLGMSAGLPSFFAFSLALSAGVAAMILVAWVMHLFMTLHAEGTVRIENALGMTATVYLTIPAKRTGAGKVTVAVQNRSMEYEAFTDEEVSIPTGSDVIVTGIVNENTVEVKHMKKVV